MTDPRTISEILADLGYGYRKPTGHSDSGQRELFVLTTGEVVGLYRAEQAIEAATAHARAA